MPKRPVSVTLEEDNLLWLRGRMARRKRRSLSDALDEVITAARTSGSLEASRTVVGTIDLPDDAGLEQADLFVRSLFEQSLSRPLTIHEEPAAYQGPPRRAPVRSSGVGKIRPIAGRRNRTGEHLVVTVGRASLSVVHLVEKDGPGGSARTGRRGVERRLRHVDSRGEIDHVDERIGQRALEGDGNTVVVDIRRAILRGEGDAGLGQIGRAAAVSRAEVETKLACLRRGGRQYSGGKHRQPQNNSSHFVFAPESVSV